MAFFSETYVPKPNKLWARVPEPMTLKALAMTQLLKTLSTVNHPLPKETESQITSHLEANLLPEFFRDLLELSHRLLVKPQSLLNLLYALPRKAIEPNVDLLGFYEGTECCKPENSAVWMFGNIPDICLDVDACKKLHNLFRSMDLEELGTLRLWVREGAITTSRLNRIFYKAVNLTRLTIRGDADDHLLRRIGASCHFLQELDVARSSQITRCGLFNLVLKRRIGGLHGRAPIPPFEELRRLEVRRITESLDTLTLSKTGLTVEDLRIMTHLLNSYVYLNLPEAIFCRSDPTMEEVASDLDWTPNNAEFLRNSLGASIPPELWAGFEPILGITLRGVQGDCQIDVYENEEGLEIFSHMKSEWLLLVVYRLSKSKGLTELNLHWNSFNWDMAELVQLADIARMAPYLERLEGRLLGTWQGRGPILEHLAEIHCWVLNDSTVISILQSCPSLKIIDVKNVRAMWNNPLVPNLSHEVLLELMEQNPRLWATVQELLIRPTNLTKASVLKLTGKCPRLSRIGDLECWDVTAEEINEINTELYNAKSQCTLVVLSFPPRPKF